MVKLNFHFYKQLPSKEKRITISTVLTLMRIALAPVIAGAMIAQWWGVACALFIVAAVSDGLDGLLARARNEQTFLGACLDPIADKILLLSCFFTLAFVPTPLFSIPLWFVLIVLCKELIVVSGTLYLLMSQGHVEMRPRPLSKVTTCVQMIFIVWLFACYFFQWLPIKTYYTMLGVLLVLVIASLLEYIIIGIRSLR